MRGPTRPGPWPRFLEAYISENVDPISIRSSQGDGFIEATLVTVVFGSLGGGVALGGSACRMNGVKIGC